MKKQHHIQNEVFQMPDEIRLNDASYLDSIIKEIEKNVTKGQEYDKFVQDYKKHTTHFIRKIEEEMLHKMDDNKKLVIVRESSRNFSETEKNSAIYSKIRRVVNFRLEELKRATKNHKWNIVTLLYDQLMKPNMHNKDLLEKLKYLDIPNDLRQKIWAQSLDNKKVADEFRRLWHQNNLLTVSKFDVQIAKDCEEFINKHMQDEAFDSKMIYTMKVILSYFERKQDRIISDYLFYICIPLMRVFGNSHYIMNPPVDLIGFFYSLFEMLKQIDPKIEYVSQHDEKYDAVMTEIFMKTLHRIDQELANKVAELLELDDAAQRNLLVSLVKRFIHSLGFEFLNMRCSLFVWDQLIMKVYAMGVEMFLVMSISVVCMKNDLLNVSTWDEFVEIYYKQSKMIDFMEFMQIYQASFQDFNFYNPLYDNVDMSEAPYSQNDVSQNADETQVIDYTKKKQPKMPKIHSTLLRKKKTQDSQEDDPGSKKSLHPVMEQAIKANVRQADPKFKQQGGTIPFLDVDEDDQDELDDL